MRPGDPRDDRRRRSGRVWLALGAVCIATGWMAVMLSGILVMASTFEQVRATTPAPVPNRPPEAAWAAPALQSGTAGLMVGPLALALMGLVFFLVSLRFDRGVRRDAGALALLAASPLILQGLLILRAVAREW